jgi:hypothetical protein
MDQLAQMFACLHSSLREVCDGINTGRMAWPEAEARLRHTCELARDLERHLTALRAGYATDNLQNGDRMAYNRGYAEGLAARLRIRQQG